jgi:hypothetical protein
MAPKKHSKTSPSKQSQSASKAKKDSNTTTLLQPIPLEKIEDIDWVKMGLFHQDLVGWTFSKITAQSSENTGPNNTPDDYTRIGLVIHSPVDLHVSQGQVQWNPVQPVQQGPFQIEKNWQSTVEIQPKRLIFHLPLKTLANQGAMILPAPEFEGFSSDLEVITTSHDNDHSQLLVIIPLGQTELTLKRGTPIAHLVPILNPDQALTNPDSGPQPETVIAQEEATAAPVQNMPEQIFSDQPASDLIPIEATAPPPFQMRVWRIHPDGVKITRATKDLRGDAPYGAMKFCGPFTHANSYGYWLSCPVDLDIIWYGGRSFDYNIIQNYDQKDLAVMGALEQPQDQYHYTNSPRHRIDFANVAENVVSIWTGCVFQTPPGWGLMIRNPINVKGESIFRIQEGILETDWLSYDIWMNLEFIQQNKWVHLRREKQWPPIAQLIPVPRKAYDDQWHIQERMMERNTPEGQNMYDRWCQYNYKKWLANSQKDSTTYHRMRTKSIPNLDSSL